jgi:hypothetical protein
LNTFDRQVVFGGAVEGTPTLVFQDRGRYYLVSEEGRVTDTIVTFALNATAGIN